jgi:hypothetical protein
MNCDSNKKLPLIRIKHFRSVSRMTTLRESRKEASAENKESDLEEKLKLLQASNASHTRIGSMEAYTGPIGLSAKMEFYDTYKNLPKYTQRNQYEGIESSPNMPFLQQVEKSRLRPIPLGVVRRKGSPYDFDLQSMRIGDEYANALSKSLKFIKPVERLNLKANRLTDRGASCILKSADLSRLKEINLSHNKVGQETVLQLLELVSSSSYIKSLSLESTSLTSEEIVEVCEALQSNTTIKRLNLARNNISDHAAQALGKFLSQSKSIRYLDLHWNKIRGKGAMSLLAGINRNKSLRSLDISWNSMGRDSNFSVAEKLASTLASNTTLKHLDVSYNYFSFEECKVISEGLCSNHTLLGLHADGNNCTIDSVGFMEPTASIIKLDVGPSYHRILSSTKRQPQVSFKNCWVCGNWVEMRFIYKPKGNEDAMFIHLECDEYLPDRMELNANNEFELTRAVPPGKIKFFFSDSKKVLLSSCYSKKEVKFPIAVNITPCEEIKTPVIVTELNKAGAEGQSCNNSDSFEIKPRMTRIPAGIREEKDDEKEVIRDWDKSKSLFKDFISDSDVRFI